MENEQLNIAVVRRLCEDWPSLSLDDFRHLMTADCHFRNIAWPDKDLIGPDQTHNQLSRFNCWDVQNQVVTIIAEGNVVAAERIEHFRNPVDGVTYDLPALGVFEMREGKIAKWRDYFDSRHTDALMAASPRNE